MGFFLEKLCGVYAGIMEVCFFFLFPGFTGGKNNCHSFCGSGDATLGGKQEPNGAGRRSGWDKRAVFGFEVLKMRR